MDKEVYRTMLQSVELTDALKTRDQPRKIVVRDGKVWLAVKSLRNNQFRVVHF